METTGDRVRAGAVLFTAVAQLVVGSFGGSGALGESVGVVANDLSTPILPAGAAFAIWSVIYLGVLALAIRQVLPGQRTRAVHRRTGWLLVAAALANMGWIALFSNRLVYVAQVVIVVLLACLAAVLARLSAAPAERGDRLLLHGPVALYVGWVSVATVVGFAAAGRAAGGPESVALGAVMLLVTAGIAAAVIRAGAAVVPYAAAVVWALLGIVVAGRPTPVLIAALVAAAVVVVVTVLRVRSAATPTTVAFG